MSKPGAAWMAAIAAAAVLGAAKPTPIPITEQIKHTQDVLNRTQVKVHNTRLKVRQARYKVLSISQQLNDTNDNIARVDGTLDGLDRSIRQIELRLGIRRHQLEFTRASLYRHRTALNGRLVDVY